MSFTLLPADVEQWLRNFALAVRERDFERGKTLFAPEVVSFGSVAVRAEGLENLVEHQWRHIWPHTRDFDFDYASAQAFTTQGQSSVLAEWSSCGFDTQKRPFTRLGRATFVLNRHNGVWRAVHSHFSMQPQR